ncbi:hypothetical protein JCM8115_003727 [Rhodotorula mucilaginosa]
MECGQEYAFDSPDQFWNELEELIRVPDDAPLEDLDYALRNYIAFASRFMDEYLSTPGTLAHAIHMLLDAPLFTSHVDRMMDNVVSSIADPNASSSTLFISLMIVLFLRDSVNPLTALTQAKPRPPPPPSASASTSRGDGAPRSRTKPRKSTHSGITVGSSKIFRRMRKRWKEVVPVLMKWVWGAAAVQVDPTQPDQVLQVDGSGNVKHLGMPAEGWEERVGTTAVAVLYEMCRVQKLDPEELADFSYEFVSHLFALVERTRDVADETFNYTLIKLIIALNEQFMVSSVPVHATGNGKLPPPILPTVVGSHKRERGPNTVLEVLKEKEYKTFGENVIFILNRADDSPDSLCVSLLILKILYLLFTTSGTQEYFYTNDLCVLVDVFIRELYNLGEDSEGLKHTYLRVLHPLLTNTQLRHYPYKRQELRECLESLLAGAQYRDVDPTTRRLVERNLRGTWCQGLRNNDVAADAPATTTTAGMTRDDGGQGGASTLSVDAVAIAEGDEPAHLGTAATTTTAATTKARRHPRQPSTSLSGGEPHRKSRKHASADDLRHHHHQHWVPSAQDGYLVTGDEGAGDGAEAVFYSQSPTMAESSFSPHALAQARFDDEGVAATQKIRLAPSSVPERIDVVRPPPTSPSSSAAVELARSTPSLRIPPPPLPPPIATQDHLPSLQHPRPRSSSLSAAAYHTSLGLAGSGSSRRASPALPPFPTAPASPVPPSPALSSVSLTGSIDSPTSPTSHSVSSRFSEAGGHRRRRRPPPPPIDAGGGGGGGALAAAAAISGSRPLTPVSRASTVDTVESEQSATATDSSCGVYAATVQSYDHQHLSPAHSVSSISTSAGHRRRRPPPPPKPGGIRDRDRDHIHHHDAESDARRLLDGLAVSS